MAKRVALGSDHAGLDLKRHLAVFLAESGHEVLDVGTHGPESVDYPDFAKAAAEAIRKSEADCAILVCGTGIGISMAANKLSGMRAALCHNAYTAAMARAHNDANMLCLGARVLGVGVAEAVAAAFLTTAFEGGRHQRRIDKIHALESN